MLTRLTYIIYAFLFCINTCDSAKNIKYNHVDTYLSKPTGQYGVAFEDIHWINQNVCPDPYFNAKNQEDFSPDNKNFCHEIMVRIYYPTNAFNQLSVPYYPPLIKSEQETLHEIPNVTKEQIEQLSLIRSYSTEKAGAITGKQFPVILFSPGLGCPAQMYENFISELVSYGYIVVAINSPFINLVELPNGHVVKLPEFKEREEIESKIVPLIKNDIAYVFDQIQILHNSSAIFSAMDLKHIGAFGHSIGARLIADLSHLHPDWFQAAVTLDIGSDETGESLKSFAIPFMHEVSARRRLVSPLFELGNEGFLIGISPTEKNLDYSAHMSFSDLSTLQDLSAYQIEKKYLANEADKKFNLKLMSHDPTEQERKSFDNRALVLVKKEAIWHLAIYSSIEKIGDVEINSVQGLNEALANLPNKSPENLSESEIEPVKKIMLSLHRAFTEFLGAGNGWEITNSINIYLTQFFNTYLKGEINPSFKKCEPLSGNTYIKCGPVQV